jgi:hypothetical protein
VTDPGRRYGEQPSYRFSVWNGLLEAKHRKRIGPAVWEYLWCLDRITRERNGVGIVLGGKPVNSVEIAKSFGVGEKTVRTHLERLEARQYIQRTLTPRGYSIRVLNSDKFGKKRMVSGRTETPDRSEQNARPPEQNARPNKTEQLTVQHDRAVGRPAGGSELWNLIRVRPEKMPPAFRELCERLYAAKNGQPLSEFVGVCMDGWQALGGARQPREFVQAANRIREHEKNPPPAPIKPLPDMPFQTKSVGQCQTQN